MMYCSNCGHAIEDSDKFCCKCGTAVAAAPVADPEPVETCAAPIEAADAAPVCEAAAPVYAAPVAVVTPVVNAEPVASVKDKVFGFVGMGLCIGALALAVMGIFYTMFGMDMRSMGFGMSVGFGMFSMPMCFIGRSFCAKSMEAGNTSAACSVGTKLGIAALIVSAVMLFFGFINLVSI